MNIKEFTDKFLEKFKSDKKMIILISAVFIVLILICFIGTDNNSDKNYKPPEEENVDEVTDIQRKTEEKLETIISRINGVGNVEVMITLGSSGEYVYAENSKKESNGDKSSFDSEIVLYESENGNDEGLIVSVKNPEILGVAVVCDGGSSAVVRAEITNLVKSLFGIGADRVYVGSNAP